MLSGGQVFSVYGCFVSAMLGKTPCHSLSCGRFVHFPSVMVNKQAVRFALQKKKTHPTAFKNDDVPIHVQWNPDFSNPQFLKNPDNSNQKKSIRIPDFSNQLNSFPSEVREIGIPL